MKNKFYSLNYVMLLLSIVLLSGSCTAYKKLPYLDHNASNTIDEELLSASDDLYEIKIKPNDILSITVNSTVPGAASDFNLPLVPTNYNNAVQTTVSSSSGSVGSIQNYLVDKDGMINFPVLGELKVSGMTTKEIQTAITESIYPRYISQKPVVNVRLLNFNVSVLGEVLRPGIYKAENQQMTILDALAAAGDMTIYGKRDNVLLVRTKDNGNIVSYQINIQDKDIVANDEVFYLQQNDKLYVQPNKAKGNNSSFGVVQTIGLSAVSIIISVIAILTR